MSEQQHSEPSETDQARAELYQTLIQLRARLDYAQRVDDRLRQLKQRVDAVRRERPAVFVGALCSVLVAGTWIVWRVIASARNARR